MTSLPQLLVIVGPTAGGKTALSLAVAERFGGEVVSCDSVAIYREFEVGTAKPSRQERAQVPHHLIDVAAPGETFTAGEYARQARVVLREIAQRGKLPIVVGGTGLYLRALLDGLFAGPPRSEQLRGRLQARAQTKAPGYLHRVLQRMDAPAAASIHSNDAPKLIRAIEVCLSQRQKMSDLWKQGRDPLTGFEIVRLGLNPERAQLYERINQRCAAMFRDGLLEETRMLLERYPQLLDIPNAPLNALGYREAVKVVRGELNEAEAVAAAQQAHRNYAKRQLTWFRKEPGVHWIETFGDDARALDAATALLAKK